MIKKYNLLFCVITIFLALSCNVKAGGKKDDLAPASKAPSNQVTPPVGEAFEKSDAPYYAEVVRMSDGVVAVKTEEGIVELPLKGCRFQEGKCSTEVIFKTERGEIRSKLVDPDASTSIEQSVDRGVFESVVSKTVYIETKEEECIDDLIKEGMVYTCGNTVYVRSATKLYIFNRDTGEMNEYEFLDAPTASASAALQESSSCGVASGLSSSASVASVASSSATLNQ